MKRIAALFAAAAALAGTAIGAPAQAAEAGVKLGVLQCNVASGWGFVIGSSHRLNCDFTPTRARVERYVGEINKFGVDIGYQRSGVLVWAVLAPTDNIAPGALAGSYGGVTAGVSVAIGASANGLIGGLGRSFTLQPVSLEGTTGLNVAAGVAGMNLHYVAPIRPRYRLRHRRY